MDKKNSTIGIDLDGHFIRLGVVRGEKIEHFIEEKISYGKSKKYILDEVGALIASLFNSDIVGIGVGVPSVVDVQNGIVYDVSRIPSWKEVPLKKVLEERFRVPVFVNNDANCFALGAKYFGVEDKFRDMVGLILGEGLGAGIIIDNKLFSGKNCGAGEFGLISYRDHNIEYYTSAQFFVNKYNIPFEHSFKQVQAGDSKAQKIFDEFGYYLGEVIQTIIYAMDPEIIVFGGIVSKAFEYFEKSMWDHLHSFPFQHTIESIEIKSITESNTALLGAAALYYDAQQAKALEAEKAQRRKAERDLLQEKNTLRAIIDNIPDNIYLKDRKCRFTKMNRAIIEWFGYENEEQVLGKTDFDIFTAKHAQKAYENEQEIMNTGQPLVNYEEKETWEDSSITWVSTSKVPLQNSRGNTVGIIGISRDITAAKQAELELRKSRNSLKTAKRETDNILQNVEEGLFLLNQKYEIGSEYSQVMETIFEQKKLGKVNFLVLMRTKIPEKDIASVKRFLDLLYNSNVDEKILESLNPLAEVACTFNNKRVKFLAFKFRRIFASKKHVSELIATVRDITEQVLLEQKLKESEEQSTRQMNWLLSILHVEPTMLKDFIDGVQKEFDFIDNVLKGADDEKNYQKILERIFRSIHLIKGNASLLALKFFADQAHQFEDKIVRIQKKQDMNHKDLETLQEKLAEMRKMLQEVHGLLDRISRIHIQMRPKRSYENKLLLQSLENLVEQLSEDQGKKINFSYNKFKAGDIPHQHQLLVKDILIQLIRNAVSHGIELPRERINKGKPESGLLELSTFKKEKSFGLRFKDDGRGIQVDKLRERAKASGRWTQEEISRWNTHKIVDTIYISGISTADKIDMLSGRGIGMDSVREKIENHGGTIGVHFETDKSCEFIITLPN
jgi:glucokinase